jgi:hypothetical protein
MRIHGSRQLQQLGDFGRRYSFNAQQRPPGCVPDRDLFDSGWHRD